MLSCKPLLPESVAEQLFTIWISRYS